jgi:hypothetical protein
MLAATSPTQAIQVTPATFAIPRIDERRATNRVRRQTATMVTPLGSTEGIACITENVSEGGAYVTAPFDCGLRLGDRCELVFGACLDSTTAQWSISCDTGAYATIIRTETATRDGEGAIGIGLRFDQPLYF